MENINPSGEIYKEVEKFHCNLCSKTFQTNLRLGKHLRNHDRINVIVCNYFRKGQYCPLEKLGCKFSHSSSKNETENETENISVESKDETHLKNNTTAMGQNNENLAKLGDGRG